MKTLGGILKKNNLMLLWIPLIFLYINRKQGAEFSEKQSWYSIFISICEDWRHVYSQTTNGYGICLLEYKNLFCKQIAKILLGKIYGFWFVSTSTKINNRYLLNNKVSCLHGKQV